MALISSAIAGTAGVAALLGAGGVATGLALNQKKKSQELVGGVETPTPETAEEKAKAEMLKKRKIQQRTGGKTILTDKFGPGSSEKTFLGQ